MGIRKVFRKVFERIAARPETPPPAVHGRLQATTPKFFNQLPAGGGSLPIRQITPDYVTEVAFLDTPEEIEVAMGIRGYEFPALSPEGWVALTRRCPLEILAFLQMRGFGWTALHVVPIDVLVTVWGAAYGVNPTPFLSLEPDKRMAAFIERLEENFLFLERLPHETGRKILWESLSSGDFAAAVRQVGIEPPRLQ